MDLMRCITLFALATSTAAGCGGLLGTSRETAEPEEPPVQEPAAPARAVVCDVAAGLAGFWTDARDGRAGPFAARAGRQVGLLLAADGTFWLAQPGWTVETGEWGSCGSGSVELATTETIQGEGGGMRDGEALEVRCRSRELLPPRRRELTLDPCAAPDGGDGPCLEIDGTVLFPSTATPELDLDEVRPLCNRGDEGDLD